MSLAASPLASRPQGVHPLIAALTLLVLATLPPCTAAETPPNKPAATALELRDGDRVVFLGDTFLEREGTRGMIEHRLTVAHPGRKVIFRNLSWSADLPTGQSRASFDWHRGDVHFRTNLLGQIREVNPSVVILGYGMAASFGGEKGLPKFKTDLELLVKEIRSQSGATPPRFAFLSPIRHEDLGAPLPPAATHNASLALYRDAIRDVAARVGSPFVDLFAPDAPSAGPRSPATALTENGIHPSASGHSILAGRIADALGAKAPGFSIGIGRDSATAQDVEGVKLEAVTRTAAGTSFSATPGRTLLPAGEGEAPKLRIQGLKSGQHVLRIDGEDVQVASAGDWAKGVALTEGPLARQARDLRQAILKKNELFFNRWRPQNSTYLFLFRKNEQGRNAAEIPQFDPLIEEQEKIIATLNSPVSRRFDWVAVERNYALKKPGNGSLAKASAPIPAPSLPRPEFDVAPGFEITLFAENPHLYKPINMNFDARGRLWVASSAIYPQIKPGQEADDSILMLEDTNGDGVADRSQVFAQGLLIPSTVIPGDGGVYVGQSTELLHFKDTDGDGKADVRRTVLSGFGTEDTHHTLHTLRWGMDGQLYMNQSIYIHTHTETPNGVVRLNSGGILNLRTDTLELGVHMKGLVNSWGHAQDLYGQSFATDGAGGEGINWVVPQAMYFTYAGARQILGSVSPGNYPKFASLEILHSPLFPADWQGNMVTCDFRAHRVVRFTIQEQGSAYVTQEQPEIVRTQSANFRPIDVKMGPDGALYIADWSNPIIQHGEVDFRDARRDKENGRIWRVAPKGRAAMPVRDLTTLKTDALLPLLVGDSGFHRENARRVLTERGPSVLPAVQKWASRQTDERAQLEALWLHQAINVVNTPLLERLLEAKDGRVRAAAVRVLAFWRQRIDADGGSRAANRAIAFLPAGELTASQLKKPMSLLAARVRDEHPRVRMEALRALSKFPNVEAAELALSAADRPLDKHLSYALWLTINDLAEPWLAALKAGTWRIAGREKQLEYGLKAIEPRLAGEVLGQMLDRSPIDKAGSGPWIELIGTAGGPGELDRLYRQLLAGGFTDPAAVRALKALDQAARVRRVKPTAELDRLDALLEKPQPEVQQAALRLTGAWSLPSPALKPLAIAAGRPGFNPGLRAALLDTLRDLGGTRAVESLLPLTAAGTDPATRSQAIGVLAAVKLDAAVTPAIAGLMDMKSEDEASPLWRALLSVKGASAALTRALPKSGIPQPVAKAGLRVARESGRSEPDLVLALTRGADLAEGEATLSESELKAMAASVIQAGDPARGERIYRRADLACVTCHAIGGAGGKVGPDMTSIGASAPVDYLIESVWFPNRKVKEGYHSLLVETEDGQELSGIQIGENADQLVLRNTQGGEFGIAKKNIRSRVAGGSLMPAGLIDGIKPEERLDLFRFLSELGKPGPYDASKGSVARGWKVRPGPHDEEQFGVEKAVARPLNAPGWIPLLSLVDGRVPTEELSKALNVSRWTGLVAVYAATQIQVPKAGPVSLQVEGGDNASLWVDGKQAGSGREVRVELSAGLHTVLLRLDPKRLPADLRLKSDDGTFVVPAP